MGLDPQGDEWIASVPPELIQRNRSFAAQMGRTAKAACETIKFLYMDCGLWAGSGDVHEPYRNFGVVCGNWAAMCNFSFGEGESLGPIDEPDAADLNAVLKAIAGEDGSVEVYKTLRYRGPDERVMTDDRIEIFLPDLHIPVINRGDYDENNFGESMGRWEFESYQDKKGYDPRTVWFERYFNADIHEGASEDLLRFIQRLKAFEDFGRVHLIQTGDMIDLWIGFECFFEGTPESEPDVELTQGTKPTGAEFTKYWADRALNQPGTEDNVEASTGGYNAAVLRELQGLDRVHFIHGNHDNYLSAEPGPLPARMDKYWHFGLYADHGHGSDSCNRDGSRGWFQGHNVTNIGPFEHPWSREAESYAWWRDNRENCIHWAVCLYNPGTAMYIHSHTHEWGLGMVKVVPGDDDIEIEDA
jgi:hypothetical protein